MSHFCILRNEAPADTFRRVAAEQAEIATTLCQSAAADPDRVTHEIRKCTKRLRSMLRLYRVGLGESMYTAEMQRFRHISAMLAPHRLSRVNLDIMNRVAAEKHPGLDPASLNGFTEFLQDRHLRLTADQLEQGFYTDTVRLFTISALREIPVTMSVDFSHLSKQIARSQKACRNRLEALERDDSAETLHELRKAVKTIWYQLTLLRTLWPPVLGATIHQLDMLAEKLGRDHDLHEMILFLQSRESMQSGLVPTGLAEMLEKKRHVHKKYITSLAGKLTAEKPSALAGRLEGYFRRW
jgi:CHAD domain-containing protein